MTPCSPTAEATDLKSVQCSFDSNHGESRRFKTHCIHGHEYNESNTIIQRGGLRAGRRLCRKCKNEIHRRFAIRHPEKVKSWRRKSHRRTYAYRASFKELLCIDCGGPRPRLASKRCDQCANDFVDINRLVALASRKPKLYELGPTVILSMDRPIGPTFRHGVDFTLHHHLSSGTASPDEIIMAAEEWAEDRKYENYEKNRDRRIEFREPKYDLDHERIAKLAATAPLPKRTRGKSRGGAINRYSPERGITQRHIKMAPTQFA